MGLVRRAIPRLRRTDRLDIDTPSRLPIYSEQKPLALMMRFRLRTLLIVVIAVGAISGVIGRAVTARYDFHHEVRRPCAQLPADDSAMLDWIRDQPGITNCYVRRKENEVFVEVFVGWMESRMLFDPEAPWPHVGTAFDLFGYKEVDGK